MAEGDSSQGLAAFVAAGRTGRRNGLPDFRAAPGGTAALTCILSNVLTLTDGEVENSPEGSIGPIKSSPNFLGQWPLASAPTSTPPCWPPTSAPPS